MATIRWQVEEFETIDSTNLWLKSRALEGAPEGLVARADFQSAGRGRLDRTWEAPARSGLLTSILLRPELAPSDLHLVTVAVALAAREAVVRLSGLRPTLKWPNDLVVNDAKIGGILAETVGDEDSSRAIVVGLGLNLTSSGPPDAGGTSVLADTGLTLEPRSVLDLLLDGLDVRLPRLVGDGREVLRAEFVSALSTVGRHVRVQRTNDEIVGTATGVDRSGRLEVTTDDGVVLIDAGDVVHLRPAQGSS